MKLLNSFPIVMTLLYVDNLGKLFGPQSGPAVDTLMVSDGTSILEKKFFKSKFRKKKHAKSSVALIALGNHLDLKQA